MAIDRFVHWHNEHPDFETLKKTLEDYIGTAGTVTVDGPRMTAVIAGRPTYPFKRHEGFEKYAAAVEQHEQRWFEVFVTKKNIDVITRQTDEFTNVVASGFAELCRRCWHGKLEDD